jgi:hypothetical protein
VREAERQAESIRRDAESAAQGARRGLDELRVRRSSFLRSLRSTTEHFLAEIDEEERRSHLVQQMDDASDVTEHQEAEHQEAERQEGEHHEQDHGSDDGHHEHFGSGGV